MLTIAFLIAFVMFIPSRSLARRTPVPYAIAVILLYALLIVVFVLGMLLITPSLVAAINNLIGSFQQGYNDLIVSLQTLKPAGRRAGHLRRAGRSVRSGADGARASCCNGSVSRTTGFLLPAADARSGPAAAGRAGQI